MYGVYQTFYQTNFLRSESASNISWIGSIQSFLLLFVGAMTGIIYDAGYLRSLLWLGAGLSIFGMMVTSICKTYWQVLLAQGIVVGCGFGLLFVPGLAVVSQYFSTKKAFATGVASTGSSLGQWHDVRSFIDTSDILIYRWCHLSHRLRSVRASHRLCLGHSCDSFHYAWYISHISIGHASKVPAIYAS